MNCAYHWNSGSEKKKNIRKRSRENVEREVRQFLPAETVKPKAKRLVNRRGRKRPPNLLRGKRGCKHSLKSETTCGHVMTTYMIRTGATTVQASPRVKGRSGGLETLSLGTARGGETCRGESLIPSFAKERIAVLKKEKVKTRLETGGIKARGS